MNARGVIQQALEALLSVKNHGWDEDTHTGRALITDLKAALEQQAEPVSMRMPKVGDKVICLEDESLGEVVSLTAGGSPDILFADGSHGTYLLREFAELFGYVASPLPVQPEPVTWDRPSASFNEWWDSDRRDTANPFQTDSFAYWAWEGWQAAQRQWVGLTDEEIWSVVSRIGTADSNVNPYITIKDARAIEKLLKDRNG